MNHLKSDKGKQVVLGVHPDHRNKLTILDELKRGKHQTNEAALRDWALTSDSRGVVCVVATIDTDRYRATVRKVADIELVHEAPPEDEIEVRHG